LDDSSNPAEIVELIAKKNPMKTAPSVNPNHTCSETKIMPIKKGTTMIYGKVKNGK
jgi:hypothetical protein